MALPHPPLPVTLPAYTAHRGTRAAPGWPPPSGLGRALQPSQTALPGPWTPRSRGSGGIPHPRSHPPSSALRRCRPRWPPPAGMARPCAAARSALPSSDRRLAGGRARQTSLGPEPEPNWDRSAASLPPLCLGVQARSSPLRGSPVSPARSGLGPTAPWAPSNGAGVWGARHPEVGAGGRERAPGLGAAAYRVPGRGAWAPGPVGDPWDRAGDTLFGDTALGRCGTR